MIFSLRDNDPPIIRGTCEKKRPLERGYNDRATKRGEKRVSLIPPSLPFVLRAHLERGRMRRRFFRWFRVLTSVQPRSRKRRRRERRGIAEARRVKYQKYVRLTSATSRSDYVALRCIFARHESHAKHSKNPE